VDGRADTLCTYVLLYIFLLVYDGNVLPEFTVLMFRMCSVKLFPLAWATTFCLQDGVIHFDLY
jgi:hypothetical protein